MNDNNYIISTGYTMQPVEDHQVPLPPPWCPHGPTILFTQDQQELIRKKRKLSKTTSKVVSTFYGCSAAREPKFCDYRMDAFKWKSMLETQRNEHIAKSESEQPPEEFAYVLDGADGKTFAFCHECCRILLNPMEIPSGIPKQHRFDVHLTYRCQKVTYNHPKSFFSSPSQLVRAATYNVDQKQAYFSDTDVSFIVEQIILKQQFRKVLCIGCPTIHEYICAKYASNELVSFLLDIDLHYQQFYHSLQFAQFNMFNYHFFNNTTYEENLAGFLHCNGVATDTVIVVDPPAFGRLGYLAETIRKIQMLLTNTQVASGMEFPPTILFAAYYNEAVVRDAFEDQLKITDYIVQYSKRHKLKGEANTQNGVSRSSSSTQSKDTDGLLIEYKCSPLRVFTNLDLSKMDLTVLNSVIKTPDNKPFYRNCQLCARYVFLSNSHCVDCNDCPARDANKPYGHCNHCNICVKSNWSHCLLCNRCHLPKACTQVIELGE